MEGGRTDSSWGWSGHSSGSTDFPSYVNPSNEYYPMGGQSGPAGPAYTPPVPATSYTSPPVQTGVNYLAPAEAIPTPAGYYGPSAELGVDPGPAGLQISKSEQADESEGGVEDYRLGHSVPLSVLAGHTHRAAFPGLRKAFMGAAARNRAEEVLRWRAVAANLEWDRSLR